ncbi:Ig-like domain-containing protein [Cellulomonas fimi]|nr:Ig-like domain-containing protein [Cellulomonas fimi]
MNTLIRGVLAALLVAVPLVATAGPAAAYNAQMGRPDSYVTRTGTVLTVAAPGVVANDVTVYPVPIRVASYGQPSNGSVTVNPDGSFVYTPTGGFVGTDAFTYRPEDGYFQGFDTRVTVTVQKDPPVANADSATTAEDTAVSGDVLANDTDPEGFALTASLATAPANGTAVVNADGTYTYTPDLDWYGTDSFTYTASDGTQNSAPATVTVTVTPVNDAPVANPDFYTTPSGTTLIVPNPGIFANDVDVDGTGFSIASWGYVPANGALTRDQGGFTYTPAPGFKGDNNIWYSVWDTWASGTAPFVESPSTTVTITVGNAVPLAADDAATTDEDVVVNGNVLTNDSDVNTVDTLTASLVTSPTNGTVTLDADGTFAYTPAANFNGTDSFTYQANDGTDSSNVATVSLTIAAVNDAPTVTGQSIVTGEDTAVSGNANASDVDGDALTVSVSVNPTDGTVVVDAVTGAFTYTPDANYYGADSFELEACDQSGLCTTATVSVTVSSVVEPPVTSNFQRNLIEDAFNQTVLPNRTTDPDHDPATDLTYSVVTGPANGTAVVVGNNLRYTPNADFNGTDTLTWQACDPDGACDPATATYTVAAVDDSPVATGESLTTTEDVPVQGSVYVTDVDSAVFTFTVSTPPSSGTVALDALGGFMYTPDADTNGADGFVVTICDDTGLCDDATVTITVSAVNDAPTAAVTGGTTQTGTAGSEVTLTAAGTDPDADSLVHRWTQTAGAAVVPAQSGAQVRFTPAAAGAYAFAVETCDPAGLCDTATVSVNVAAAPVVAPVTSAPAAAAPAAAALAATGFNGGLLGLGALALVALGWALTGASRRAVSIRRH